MQGYQKTEQTWQEMTGILHFYFDSNSIVEKSNVPLNFGWKGLPIKAATGPAVVAEWFKSPCFKFK